VIRRRGLRRFLRSKLALASAGVLAGFFATALFGPALSPFGPLEQDLENNYAPPSARHLLGTDDLGRDTFSRLVHGARFSLGISGIAVSIGLVVGTFLGLVAAHHGGAVDAAIMRAMDVLLALPGIVLAIAVVALLGPGLTNTIAAVSVFSIPTFARVVRSAALAVRELEFVTACRALGGSDFRVIVFHLLPNCSSPVVVQTSLMLASAILIASGLSFLGLGVQPPYPEWGAMLAKGRELIRVTPVGAVAPGVAITLVVASLGFFGDALKEALEP